MMRRILLPVALLVLGGTLVAQNGTVVTAPRLMTPTSFQREGDVTRLKGFRLEFPNGLSLVADEAVLNATTGTIELSGNARLTGATRIVPPAK